MAELYQSRVDRAWSESGDRDSSTPAEGHVAAPPIAPWVPSLVASAQRALPLPPAVMPEATSTFTPVPLVVAPVATRVRGGYDATLLVRPMPDPYAIPRPRSRGWIAAVVAVFAAAALIVVVTRFDRGRHATPAPATIAQAAPHQLAVAKQTPAVKPTPARSAKPKRVATATATAKPKHKAAAKKVAKPKATATATKAAKPKAATKVSKPKSTAGKTKAAKGKRTAAVTKPSRSAKATKAAAKAKPGKKPAKAVRAAKVAKPGASKSSAAPRHR